MKPLYFIFFYFLLAATAVSAQTTFQKQIGLQADELYPIAKQTSDGGYIATGTNTYLSDREIFLVKLTSGGAIVWKKKFGGTYQDARDVQQTSDGGYIICGSCSTSVSAMYMIKTNATGDTTWTRSYRGASGASDTYGYTIQQTSDGGYILCGYGGFGGTYNDAVLIKTDASGNLQWSKGYGTTNDDYAYYAQPTSDGGYILVGKSGFDLYIAKVTSTGTLSWTKAFGGTGFEEGHCIRQTSDGGYIAIGTTESYAVGQYDIFVVKITSSGSLTWSKVYGTSSEDEGWSVKQTTDGGYIMSGNVGYIDCFVMKTNSIGDTAWTRTYGSGLDDQSYNIIQTTDGGYLSSGRTNSFGGNGYELYLVKMDANGNTGCYQSQRAITVSSVTPASTTPFLSMSPVAVPLPYTTIVSSPTFLDSAICLHIGINELEPGHELIISPNPFTKKLHIGETSAKGEIVIYSMEGREIMRRRTDEGETVINAEELSAGVYIYRYTEENKYANGKLVKF
jgi:hypothetical protein